MGSNLRKELPFWVGLAAAAIIMVDYFFNIPALSQASKDILQWRIILSAFALALGIGNLTRIHSHIIAQRKPYWTFSVLLLFTLYAYLLLGIATTTRSPQYKFWWDNLYQPLHGTWYSMTVFYMTSACWRAFRIRNSQAAIMLASAVLVMLGNVGIGKVMWSQLPVIAAWINSIPTNAGMRGITIGASLGMISLSLRVIVGLERGHLGGVGE
jgi:hypothetical protein